MVEPAGPIDSDIAFPTVQPRSTFHATTRTNATKLEEAVKDRTIVTNVEAALLFLEVLHIIRGYSLQKIDILVGVELGHFKIGGGFGALNIVSIGYFHVHWGAVVVYALTAVLA